MSHRWFETKGMAGPTEGMRSPAPDRAACPGFVCGEDSVSIRLPFVNEGDGPVHQGLHCLHDEHLTPCASLFKIRRNTQLNL